jgi:hypothetical protein
MTLESQVRMYMDHLTQLGFVPELGGEKDIRFKVEGGLYQILVDANEPIFFRLVFPRFRKVRDAEDRARVEAAANHASANTKVAKVYLSSDDYVSAAVELFCSPPEAFKPVFERSLDVLQYAVNLCKKYPAS